MNGPRPGLGWLHTVLESARQTWWLALRDRLWWVVAAGVLVLPALTWLLAGRAREGVDGRSLYCVTAWWLLGIVVIPWLTLYLGVQAVHGRLEDRTFQYVFLRPVARSALLLGHWLAVVAMSTLVAVVGAGALMVGLAGREPLWPDGVDWHLAWVFAYVLSAGAVVYAAVAVLFAAWFRRPLVWAAGFVVGVQTLAANLPVSAGMRQLTITDPMRRMMLDAIEPDQRLARRLWPAEREFALELVEYPLRDLAVLLAVTLLLAIWAFGRTEYDSRDRE